MPIYTSSSVLPAFSHQLTFCEKPPPLANQDRAYSASSLFFSGFNSSEKARIFFRHHSQRCARRVSGTGPSKFGSASMNTALRQTGSAGPLHLRDGSAMHAVRAGRARSRRRCTGKACPRIALRTVKSGSCYSAQARNVRASLCALCDRGAIEKRSAGRERHREKYNALCSAAAAAADA